MRESYVDRSDTAVLRGGFGGAAIGLLYVICGKVGRIELHLGKIAEKS